MGKQMSESFILVNRAQFIAHPHPHIPFGIDRTSHPHGFFWNRADFLWVE